jgi:hypothetical protein
VSVVLPVELDVRPLHRTGGDVIAAPLFATGMPIRGPAAWLDWRLCGQVARTFAVGQFSPQLGHALLVPSRGRVRAGWVLVAGAGDPASWSEPTARAWAESVVARAAALRAAQLTLALPTERVARLALERTVAGFLAGAAAALAARPTPLRLRIAIPAAEAGRAEHALAAAPRSYPGGLIVRVERAAEEPSAPTAERPREGPLGQSPSRSVPPA